MDIALETGGLLLVIALMLWAIVKIAGLAERLYVKCKGGIRSKKTTEFQRREIFVNFADLARQSQTIQDSVL